MVLEMEIVRHTADQSWCLRSQAEKKFERRPKATWRIHCSGLSHQHRLNGEAKTKNIHQSKHSLISQIKTIKLKNKNTVVQ